MQLCALNSQSQIVILSFNEPVYLTQLRARSNSVDMNIFLDINQTYQNTIEMDVSL